MPKFLINLSSFVPDFGIPILCMIEEHKKKGSILLPAFIPQQV
jgi:hypothetical protein